MGVSENSVYPFVPNGFADHYPYEMAISLGILTQHFQTNPYVTRHWFFVSPHFSSGDRRVFPDPDVFDPDRENLDMMLTWNGQLKYLGCSGCGIGWAAVADERLGTMSLADEYISQITANRIINIYIYIHIIIMYIYIY